MKYKRGLKEAPFVKLEALEQNKGILIKVSDNGEGISEEWKEKIFDLFTRASDQSSGFGLGLYIVRNAVQTLRGTISVESERNHGSSFNVWLPLR
jgi:signal transduction histidine kinase